MTTASSVTVHRVDGGVSGPALGPGLLVDQWLVLTAVPSLGGAVGNDRTSFEVHLSASDDPIGSDSYSGSEQRIAVHEVYSADAVGGPGADGLFGLDLADAALIPVDVLRVPPGGRDDAAGYTDAVRLLLEGFPAASPDRPPFGGGSTDGANTLFGNNPICALFHRHCKKKRKEQ